MPVIKVENIKKTYYMGDTKVHALRGVSLEVQRGEFVAIMGPSGSGKTTFMNLPGCLDRPTRGTYTLAGRLVSDLSADELAAIRNQLIGFVFQGFNLLTRATALNNVMLPLMYAGYARERKKIREVCSWSKRCGQTMGVVASHSVMATKKGDRWGLNPQPLEPQSRALPIELRSPRLRALPV